MSIVINAYCTQRELPPLRFPHHLNAQRGRDNPELVPHLDGFIGYVLSRRPTMTQVNYQVVRHLKRVKHHLSFNLEQAELDALSTWSWDANAILYMADGTVRDPNGQVLVTPDGIDPDPHAPVPHPSDALERHARINAELQSYGLPVFMGLPPVLGASEVEPRSASEVAHRCLALFVTALYADLFLNNQDVSVPGIKERWPTAFTALSPAETTLFAQGPTSRQHVLSLVWRFEALNTLLWTLNIAEKLAEPTQQCDMAWLMETMDNLEEAPFVAKATLRPIPDMLDALDRHYRLHWIARQARQEGKEPPGNLSASVIMERHYALNWLLGFENEDTPWDDIDTPT